MSADYPKMYAILCGAASDAIDFMDREEYAQARECLRAALEKAESLYLDAGTIIPFPPKDRL